MFRKIHVVVISGILLLLVGTQLNAQGVIISKDTIKTPEVKLGEIVIKASKDQLLLKEMPASVSIVSAKELERNEVRSLTGLTAAVPNLFMPDYGSKLTSPIYIRGIGSRINSPAVGLYVDNVPFFEKSSHNFDFFDLERIEVLRGPQGTLYGRNSRGGIINVTTLSPMDYQGTRLKLSLGTHGTYNVAAGHYGKSGDFAYSLSANYNHRDGFFKNEFNGDNIGMMDSYGLRNRLIWNISDKLSLENILSFENSEEGGYPYALFDSETSVTSGVNYNLPSSYNRKMISDALIFKYKSDAVELTSTTAFQYLDDAQAVDQDFTVDSLFFVTQDQILNQLSQEFILRSTTDKQVSWLVGLSGFSQKFDRSVGLEYGKDGIAKYKLPGSYSYVKDYDKQISGGALFGQIKVDDLLIENLSVTAGVRIDAEKETLKYNYDKTVLGTTSNSANIDFNPIESFEILPKIALNYRFENSNIYATVAKGYKAGGFNSSFEHVDSAFYKPESAMNYEMGVKTSLFNKMLYVDFSVFYIQTDSLQIYQTLRSGRGSMLTNAGESVSQGFEVSFRTVAIYGFETSVNYGFTDAKFTDHVVNATTDYTGNYVPFAPKHTFSLNINKTIDLNGFALMDRVNLNFLYRGAGDTYWKEDNAVVERYYDVIDAGITFVKDNLQVGLSGKNLANSQYHSFYFTALGNEYVQLNNPRWFGVNLSYKF